MNEVKKPRKPLIFYYCIVLICLILFNSITVPWLMERQVKEVDYGTFISMTEKKQVDRVDLDSQENVIYFTDKEEQIYKTAMVEDAGLTDFQAHQMEHQLGALTDCNHGQGLAVIHPAYYRHILKDAEAKFTRFAKEVFGVETAEEGINALEAFIKECGLPTSWSQLASRVDITPELLRRVADTCNLIPSGPRALDRDEIYEILMECM